MKIFSYHLCILTLIMFHVSGAIGQVQLPAFPGAEGHGKYTTGGRGGRVIYVTSLADTNTQGTLRYAINQTGARIIEFKLSGTIQLTSDLKITQGNLTIAGQTAPGEGICLRDYPVINEADNVIIRFMRFRMGDAAQQENDALGGRFHKNIMIDHCTASWSTDECVSFYQNENLTLQWCLVSESLRTSVHAKGSHGYGGVWGGKNCSFHHNMLASHDSRNPRLGEYAGDIFALTDNVDLRNNVIYNWQGNSCYGGEAMNVNIVNCYYKPGPATTKNERIISIDKNKVAGTAVYDKWGKFYINGNVLEASTRATDDNWTYGVYSQFHSSYGTVSEADKIAMRIAVPHNQGEVTTHSAQKAYNKVLDYVGASLVRDTIDKRIIHDVRTGTATYMNGGNGSVNGIIDTQTAVGGWPELKSLQAPADSDNDGMPDTWEDAHGLSKNDPSDAQKTNVDSKYPNVEAYLNSLVASITENELKDALVTSVENVLKINDSVKIYLNNSSGVLQINHQEIISEIIIYNITGALVKSKVGTGRSETIVLNDINTGIYIVSVRDRNGSVYSKKIVKTKE